MKSAVFALAMLFAAHWLNAQAPSAADGTASKSPTLFVYPSTAAVSFGKASLEVNPLTHRGKFYVGTYVLKVVPYFFMSENGTLKLDAPDESLKKLLRGDPVAFTGRAINNKDGKPKFINGEAIPSANDRGKVTFFVQTDNGPMVFKTSYRFGE